MMSVAEGDMTRCAARRLLYEVPHVLAPQRRIAPFQQEGERAGLEDPSKRSSCAQSDPTSRDLSEIRFVVGRDGLEPSTSAITSPERRACESGKLIKRRGSYVA